LTLGACWTSQHLLLDPHAGAQALRAGVYHNDKHPDDFRVQPKGHGWYLIGNGSPGAGAADDKAFSMYLTHFPGGAPDVYVAAVSLDECVLKREACEGWTYLLLKIDGREVHIAMPACAGDGDIAKRFGATADGGARASCVFTDAGKLHDALVEYGKPGAFTEMVRRK
jgi:hypothetical protein